MTSVVSETTMASTISKKSTSSYAEKVQVFTKESEFSERDTSPLVSICTRDSFCNCDSFCCCDSFVVVTAFEIVTAFAIVTDFVIVTAFILMTAFVVVTRLLH